MSEEQSPPDDDGNDDPKPDGEEPRYTKEQLSRAIARETAKVQRRYERKLESVAPVTETKPEAKPEPQAQPDDVGAKLARLEEDMAYKDALLDLGGVPLDGAKRKALRAFFDPSKPETLSDAYSALWPGDKPPAPASEPKAEIKPEDIPSVGEQYTPGAAQPQAVEPVADPREWTKADIEQLRSRGDFLAKVEAWRSTLPGNASVFRKKPPKG